MLYYGTPGDLYEEIYFIECGKDEDGIVKCDAKELNEYSPLRTKWNE